MKSNSPVKSLIKIAFYTSPVIGLLMVLPLFISLSQLNSLFFITFLFLVINLLITWLINISLVYVFEKYFSEKFVSKFRYPLSYLLVISISIILILTFNSIIHNPGDDIEQNIHRPPTQITAPITICFFLNTVIIIIQEIFILKNKKTKIEQENAQLKIKNSEAYYQQLKQQIHPHFLFNSLNILKALIKKNPGIAEAYLVKLSDFIRASISSSNLNTVKLTDEIKLSLDYLEMQKLRFGNSLEYEINIPEKIKITGSVPVFSIQLLLENAIKHNSLTNEQPLKINVTYHEGTIEVSNNIQYRQSSETTIGLGLANLTERYKILSGNDIIINKNEKTFCVKIKVLHYENSDN